MLYDLNEEESDGIQLEDRKRRRGANHGLGLMEIDMGQQTNGTQLVTKKGETINDNSISSNGNPQGRVSKNEQMAGTAVQSRQTL